MLITDVLRRIALHLLTHSLSISNVSVKELRMTMGISGTYCKMPDILKLFRRSIFLSICHPERSEGPYAGYNTLERDRSVVVRSFAALRMTDFLTL